MKKLAVVILDGSLESATLCAEALNKGYDVTVLNIEYNQKNWINKYVITKLLAHFKLREDFKGKIVDHFPLNIDNIYSEFNNLLNKKYGSDKNKDKIEKEINSSFHDLLLSVISAMIGEIIAFEDDYDEVVVGLNVKQTPIFDKKDISNLNITVEFAKRLGNLLSLNKDKKISLFTPFVYKFTEDIVLRAKELKVPYKLTWSCESPKQVIHNTWMPCGKCKACTERQLAGESAGIDDINNYHIKI